MNQSTPRKDANEKELDGNNRNEFRIRLSPQPVGALESTELEVAALLNKLTMENFDSISDQIIEWANKLDHEKDGIILMQIIKLVFEKAKDEAAFSEMYARLCRKMIECVSPNIQDESIKNSEGQPITGGMLFRKYLLNRCQEDFERGWSAKEAALAAATLKSEEDKTAEAASGGTRETVLNSGGHYADVKAKRQGLGLARFIGELFKLQMLTERIMHACIQKLLSNVANPEEEEVESLCELLTAVGQHLDNPKAKNHMDIYFERMQDMAKSNSINSRTQSMLLDVIELRSRNWQARPALTCPSPVHQGSRGDSEEYGVSRGGSRREEHTGDMFSALGTSVAYAPPSTVERTTGSRDPSGNFGPGRFCGTAGPGERRNLAGEPRFKPAETEVTLAAMTEEEYEKKVKEDVKEYLAAKDIDEAIMALEALPSERRHMFVDRLVNASMGGGNKVVVLAEKLFAATHSHSVVSPEGFERGMLPIIEMADDLSIDVPKTYEWLARMIYSAGLDRAKVEEMARTISVLGEPRVPPRELLMKEFEKVSSNEPRTRG